MYMKLFTLCTSYVRMGMRELLINWEKNRTSRVLEFRCGNVHHIRADEFKGVTAINLNVSFSHAKPKDVVDLLGRFEQGCRFAEYDAMSMCAPLIGNARSYGYINRINYLKCWEKANVTLAGSATGTPTPTGIAGETTMASSRV